MAKLIYFVRHGESLDNVAGVTFDEMTVQEDGFLDNPLSELGERQAEAAADWFISNGIRPDAIYSSGLSRATLTAKPLAEYCGMDIRILPDLREVFIEKKTLGSLKIENNMSRVMMDIPGGKELRDEFMKLGVFVAFNTWANFGLPGFEPKEQLMGRAAAALDTLAAQPERVIVAVAHNFFLCALLLELIRRNPLNYAVAGSKLGMLHNCSATCVVCNPPRFRLRYAGRRTSDL